MWELYQRSKQWGTRPAEILGIDDDYVAWCIDQAVFHFGVEVEGALNKVEGKTKSEIERKQRQVLDKYLRDKNSPRRFADPAAMLKGG